MRIATGITTAPRPEAPTLFATCFSWLGSGLDGPIHVFHEPGSSVLTAPYVRNFPSAFRRGSFGNLIWGLQIILRTRRRASHLLMLQDDVRIARNVDAFLRHEVPQLRGEAANAILSLYTSSTNHVAQRGWHEVQKPTQRYGALAYLFPREVAQRLVDEFGFEDNPTAIPEPVHQADIKLARWCDSNAVGQLWHSPSLIEHTGEISTISDMPITEARQCKVFCEDALKLIPEDAGRQLLRPDHDRRLLSMGH